MTGARIYLDYQATTPCDPRVVDAMLPWFTQKFGNPHSTEHAFGWEAADAVEEARGHLARAIGARPREIVFTSGATEANNLAIKGALATRMAEGRDEIVTLATEHKCVLESARDAARLLGGKAVIVPVGTDGLVDTQRLAAAIGERTALVSVMAANNEIGTIQPLAEIAEIAHAAGAWFHSDAAQGVGKMALDVQAMGIDLMSISGHKLYGPKGVGALYIRSRGPKVELAAQMSGGGQERGLRSGTVSPPLVVGLGEAARLAAQEWRGEAERLTAQRDRLLMGLQAIRSDIRVNGTMQARLPGNLSITIPGIAANDLYPRLNGLAVSSGSACSSEKADASHVLLAIGHDPARVDTTLRLGLGRMTTDAEIEQALAIFGQALR